MSERGFSLRLTMLTATAIMILVIKTPFYAAGSGGVVGSSLGDTTRYRTFSSDSLVERRAIKRASIGASFCATFTNSTSSIISGIQIQFKYQVTLTGYAPFPEATSSNSGKAWNVFGQMVAPGDSFMICGVAYGKDTSPILEWTLSADDPLSPQPGFIPSNQSAVFAMPNTANVRTEVYEFGGFGPGTSESDAAGGMVIGRSFMRLASGKWRPDPDSARKYGWVRLRKSTDILRSLHPLRNGAGHTGLPRGFDHFDNGKPFVKQILALPPVKMNNRLFAELVALKLNIAASALGITPVGFGELIYADPGHPFDHLMITQIADRADTMMTNWMGLVNGQYIMLDSVLHKINGAFSGPIDTISFASVLSLIGVRPLSDISFLRPNLLVPPTIVPRIYHPEFAEDENGDDDELVPQHVEMAQNYPNPFNPTTTIQFELSDNAMVTIVVYDVLGRRVAVLAENELYTYGTNEIPFDAHGLASGVYFYRIVTADIQNAEQTSQRIYKMMLLK